MSTLIDIQKQIAELQAQAAEIKASELNEKLAMIKETMAAYGIKIEDLQDKATKATRQVGSKSTNPAPAKFSGPNGESWTGRGLMPKWMTALVADGHKKEEYLINK